MRILVTGDTGFIGKHILTHLRNKNHEVYGCSRSSTGGRSRFLLVDKNSQLQYEYDNFHFILDLTDGPSVQVMLSECNPDCIIHCAANPIVKPDPNDPTRIYEDNVKSTHLLCHYAPNQCKFIFTSSIVIYGDVITNSLNQYTDIYETHPTLPTSMYGVTKVAAENIIRFYKDKLDICIFRLGATIGSGLTHGIIYDFIKKLRSNSEYLEVLGDYPGSAKPFLHISDLLYALDFSLDGLFVENTLNVCNTDFATVADIAEAVKKVTRINKEVKWLGSAANWKGDNKVLKACVAEIWKYGWNPSMSSIEAIERTVKENL